MFFFLEVSLSKFMILWNHPKGTAKHHFLLVPRWLWIFFPTGWEHGFLSFFSFML